MKKGIIVIDDAWPVTDALCLTFADAFMKQVPAEPVRITYARMLATSWALFEEMRACDVEFLSQTGGTDRADARQQLDKVVKGVPDDPCTILIVQERSFIRLFYDMLAELSFREHIHNTFALVASDYALGTAMNGTDVLRRFGSGFQRLLISAQAEETLPRDWNSVCDARIDKSTIRITTLARRLLDVRAASAEYSEDTRDNGRDPCQAS